MPKLTKKLPSYRLHKVSGHAVVTIAGRDHYLGAHGSPESFDAYKRLISEWSAAGPAAVAANAVATKSGADFRICELLAAYYEHADRYYVKDGEPTGEAKNIKDATRLLQSLYGMTPVAEFGPMALKAVRQKFIEARLSRRVINYRVNRIRRVFKWGVENQLVTPQVLHGLQAVAAITAFGRLAKRDKRIL